MTFGFKEQLKVGDKGQELFIKHYHSPLIVFPEHKADFKRVTDGKLVELKTDTYSMAKTPNFFIERYSDFNKKTPGSFWQSLEKKVPIFCYLFLNDGVYFEFDTKEAVKFLNPLAEVAEKKGLIWIKNNGWVTAGFKVTRESMKHLYKEYRFEVK